MTPHITRADVLRALLSLRPARIRLLPLVIFCAAFTLTLKLGTIWHDAAGVLAPTAAVAEEKPADGAQKPPPAKDGKTDEKKAAAAAGDAKKSDNAADGEKDKDGRGERTGRPNAWFDPALVTDSELEVLQKLSERRTELEKRGREVETREKLLQATEKRIDAKLAQLKQIQDTISALLKKHDQQKEEQLKSVVKIYENMKPKEAARIFEELDMAILLDVVERMREARTAPILASLTPGKAKAVTAALAQRRALPNPGASDPRPGKP